MALPAPTPLRLVPPAPGDPALAHDATFVAWDRTFGAARDVVNLGIDALNQAGAGLPRLPTGSLEELLVLPLAGDYGAIAQNAEACRQVRDALDTWSANALRLSWATDRGWDGAAARAFLVRLDAHALGARLVGELVARGAAVLDEIAREAERIALEVERLVVCLGRTLARLARRLLEKVAGPAGWAVFALELATHGLDAVTDIVDDVRLVLSVVDALQDLQRTVAAWAGDQRARIAVLADLLEVRHPGLTAL